jgi:hypothetical protein
LEEAIMVQLPPDKPDPREEDSRLRGRFALPAWLLSVVLHATLVIVLGLALRITPRGDSEEDLRVVGVVLKQSTPEGEIYENASDAAPTQLEPATEAAPPLSEALMDAAPTDAASALPDPMDVTGLGPPSLDGFLPGANSMAGRDSGDRNPSGGKARTGVFGVEGEGSTFVYVFDRSGSMGSTGLLQAAKNELIASLQNLEDINQFQIIFYNETPTMFPIGGQRRRLVFGTDEFKERAARFVESITADGATRHEDALIMALRLSPDVIFFLTDADEPSLSKNQLRRIAQMNSGRTVIHTIEFGFGPELNDDNFLVRMARQNNGRHIYIDISKLNLSR